MADLKLTGKHILLLMLYSPGIRDQVNEPISGRTRIMKMMFLFKQEIKKQFTKDVPHHKVDLPEFTAWKYGPFSKQVYDDIEFFVNNEFVKVVNSDREQTEPEREEVVDWAKKFLFKDEVAILEKYPPAEEEFTLESKGKDFVESHMWSNLSDNQKAVISRFKKVICTASLQAILRYTYVTYPETTEKSEIKGRIIG